MIIRIVITTIFLATFPMFSETQDESPRTTLKALSSSASWESSEVTTDSAPKPPTPPRPQTRSRLERPECKGVLPCSGGGGEPSDPNRVLKMSFLTSCGMDWTRNFLGHKIVGALSLAVDTVNRNRLLPDNYSLVYEVHNTQNLLLESVGQVCRDSQSSVSVFVGPEQSCDTEATVAAAANKPLLSYACHDGNSSQADGNATRTFNYNTFVRFNPAEKTVLHNVVSLLLKQEWSYFRIVYSRDMKNKAERLNDLAKNSPHLEPLPMRQVDGMLQIHEMLRETKHNTRIYVLLAHRGEVSNFLIAMTLQGMLKQPQLYLIVFLESEEHHAKDWITYIWGQSLPSDLSQRQRRRLLLGYSRALLMVRGAYPHSNFNHMRKNIICRNVQRPFCLTYSSPDRLVVPYQASAYLYDAVVEYAKAVRRLYDSMGGTISVPDVAMNGPEIVSKMRHYTYRSSLGYEVTLDGKAESRGNYSGYLFHSCSACRPWSGMRRPPNASKFECPASGSEGGEGDEDPHTRDGKTLPASLCEASYRGERVNPADFADEEDASCFVEVVKFQRERVISHLAYIDDEPACGMFGEKCASSKDYLPWILAALFVMVLVLMMFLFLNHIIIIAEKKITGLEWKIAESAIEDCYARPRGSTRSLAQLNPSGDFFYFPVGIYLGTTVCRKPAICTDKKNRFRRELMKDIHRIRSIKHRNVCTFYGVCVDHQKVELISEYQARGSLRDVLRSEHTNLDEAFIESLMMDLIKGMCFLHEKYGPHGYLRTSNCVVSGRWVLQVTDYGLAELRVNQRRDMDTFKWLFNQLYLAPELLKEKEGGAATKEADVYAFGIILHETLNRRGPFGLCDDDFDGSNYEATLNNILSEIKREPDTGGPLKRPSLAQIVEKPFGTNVKMITLMKKCWEQNSSLRPSFKAIKNDFAKLGEKRPADLMDHLMTMMERHNDNLEMLIESRTQELQREKELTDQLLYSVLPRPVAQALKHGIAVEPQSFESVTIYFSDIVGFTALSAESTPLQIVTFLDELYRMFDDIISGYDVYKVETIGDAYMVVSGLPEKQKDMRHAGEIASMSLELVAKAQAFKIPHKPEMTLELRVGVHTGPVMAGVVGLSMPRYCLFGDTVNTAARFESNGLPNKIHISSACRRALEQLGGYIVEKRGMVEMKGKGEQETHWLLGAKEGAIKRRLTPPRTPGHCFQRRGDQHRRSRSSNRVSFGDDKTCSLPPGSRAPLCLPGLPERQRLLDTRHRCSSISGIGSDLPSARLRKGLTSTASSVDKILPNSLLNLASPRLDEVVESKPLLPKFARGCDRRSHPQSPLIESSV